MVDRRGCPFGKVQAEIRGAARRRGLSMRREYSSYGGEIDRNLKENMKELFNSGPEGGGAL